MKTLHVFMLPRVGWQMEQNFVNNKSQTTLLISANAGCEIMLESVSLNELMLRRSSCLRYLWTRRRIVMRVIIISCCHLGRGSSRSRFETDVIWKIAYHDVRISPLRHRPRLCFFAASRSRAFATCPVRWSNLHRAKHKQIHRRSFNERIVKRNVKESS